jgi:hypothetical protein
MARSCLWVAVLTTCVLAGAGCQHRMALNPDATSLDTSRESVAIFTITFVNSFKPACQPPASIVAIKDANGSSTDFWIANPASVAAFSSASPVTGWTATTVMVSVALPPGAYTIGKVEGWHSSPLLSYQYGFPLNKQFTIEQNEVAYIGHFVMTNREAKAGEPRTGAPIPLVDHLIAGFSNGTIDVTVIDESKAEIPVFVKTYPCLKGRKIRTAVQVKAP